MKKVISKISIICLFGLLLSSCSNWKIKTQTQSLEKLPIYFERIEKILNEYLDEYTEEEISNYIMHEDQDNWRHHISYTYFFNDYELSIGISNEHGYKGEYIMFFESAKYETINDVKKIPEEYLELLDKVGLVCCTKDELGPGAKKFLELEEQLYDDEENLVGGKTVSETYYLDNIDFDQYSYTIWYKDGLYYTSLFLASIPMKNL